MNAIFVQILNILHNIVKKIPYGRQSIFKKDLDEVVKSLDDALNKDVKKFMVNSFKSIKKK